MHREEKKETVTELADKLGRCSIVISTDYRGLPVAEMNEIRRRLRQTQIEYRVVKNTLIRLAAEQANREEIVNIVEGPTAIAFGYGNVVEPAKVLLDYIRSSGSTLKIIGGLVGQRVLSPSDIAGIATLPSKEVLVGKLLGMMKAPIASLVNVLNANIAGLAHVLNARMKQLEGGSN